MTWYEDVEGTVKTPVMVTGPNWPAFLLAGIVTFPTEFESIRMTELKSMFPLVDVTTPSPVMLTVIIRAPSAK